MAHLPARLGLLSTSLAALLAAAPLALAQAPSPQQMQAQTEQHIAGIKAQLHITPAEEGAWDQFAGVMQQNAVELSDKLAARSAGFAKMNAVDDLKSYADITALHAQEASRLVAPFEALYAQLSPAQRQEADTLFHNGPGGMRHGPVHG